MKEEYEESDYDEDSDDFDELDLEEDDWNHSEGRKIVKSKVKEIDVTI